MVAGIRYLAVAASQSAGDLISARETISWRVGCLRRRREQGWSQRSGCPRWPTPGGRCARSAACAALRPVLEVPVTAPHARSCRSCGLMGQRGPAVLAPADGLGDLPAAGRAPDLQICVITRPGSAIPPTPPRLRKQHRQRRGVGVSEVVGAPTASAVPTRSPLDIGIAQPRQSIG